MERLPWLTPDNLLTLGSPYQAGGLPLSGAARRKTLERVRQATDEMVKAGDVTIEKKERRIRLSPHDRGMEWLYYEAKQWFVRNAALIAGIESALIVIYEPSKMLMTYFMNRRRMKATARDAAQLEALLSQRLEASEANAARRHQELVDLRSVLAKVAMEPLGDSARVGRLPDGTNIVEMPNGQIRLALPVRLSAAFSAAPASFSATVLKISPPEQGPDDG